MVQFERRPRDSAATYVPVFEGSSGTTFRRSIRRLRSGLATPTQKPLALMKRIIKASSNEGDIVKNSNCTTTEPSLGGTRRASLPDDPGLLSRLRCEPLSHDL